MRILISFFPNWRREKRVWNAEEVGGEPKNQNLQNLADNVFTDGIVRKESVEPFARYVEK
jgi:hypothetical protein